MINSDRSDSNLFDQAIRIQNFHFSRKLLWKNSWKLPKLLRCRNAHNFQTIENYDLKFRYNKLKTFSYLLYIPRNKPSMSVTLGIVRLIVLNDSTTPKMYIKMYFNCFLIFLKDFKPWVFKDMQTPPPLPSPSVMLPF